MCGSRGDPAKWRTMVDRPKIGHQQFVCLVFPCFLPLWSRDGWYARAMVRTRESGGNAWKLQDSSSRSCQSVGTDRGMDCWRPKSRSFSVSESRIPLGPLLVREPWGRDLRLVPDHVMFVLFSSFSSLNFGDRSPRSFVLPESAGRRAFFRLVPGCGGLGVRRYERSRCVGVSQWPGADLKLESRPAAWKQGPKWL